MNRTSRVSLQLFVAIAVVLTASPTQAESVADGRPLLDKVIEFYAGLDTVRVEMGLVLTATEKGEEGPEKSENAFSVALQRPDLLSMKAKGDSINLEVVCDGTKLYVYSPEDKLYSEHDAPERAANVVGMTGQGILRVGTMFMSEVLRDDPFKKLAEDLEAARDLGTEAVDGIACHHIACTHPEVDWEMWIDAGDRPLIYKMAIDIAKLLKESAQDAPTYDLVITYRDWEVNPEIPESAFTFTPPEGVEKFDPSESMDQGPSAEALEGKPAPAFSLDLLGGGTMDLAKHKGKDIVILDFWATWCGPCRQALPVYASVAKAYKDKGVVFYAVNLGESPEQVKAFVDKMELDCPVALDTDNSAAKKYGVRSIPTSVVIGKDGTVRKVHIGLAPDLETSLGRELEELLAEKSGEK